MRDFIDIIKSDKKSKVLFVITIGVLFVCTLSYSLSMFSNSREGDLANIKVNGLSFNMTTNSGESDDRILKLKANTLESFNVIVTNLNDMDVKYELIYEVCSDSSCSSTLDKLPDDMVFGISNDSKGLITDTLVVNENTNIILLSNNSTDTDYYIKLNLNAGYSWNELALVNQIEEYHKDIDFIAYVDGVEQSNFPDSCYYDYTYKTYVNGYETSDSEVKLTCSNGVWNINVKNVPSKVKVWFTPAGINAVDYLVNLETSDVGKSYLRYDNMTGWTVSSNGTGNLRYYGSGTNADDVPNYVSFNNELWRIIGVFEVYNASTYNYEKALKIIRSNALGVDSNLANINSNTYTSYSWDTSSSSINSGYGINEWSQADLMNELNGDYLNTSLTSDQYWYSGYNEESFRAFTYTQRIGAEYQQYMIKARWYLGAYNSRSGVSAATLYTYERNNYLTLNHGSSCGTNCNDTVTRTSTWDGKVALPYVSDFGFAAINNGISNCSDDLSISDNCSKTYNWMSKQAWQWTLTPYYENLNAAIVYTWFSSANIAHAGFDISIRPTLYLTTNTLITSGTGTSSNPYQISL